MQPSKYRTRNSSIYLRVDFLILLNNKAKLNAKRDLKLK